MQQTGVLATSSANISGQDTLMTMEAIERAFPDILVFDWLDSAPSGSLASGLPSTVVCWQNQGWQILRQGSVTI